VQQMVDRIMALPPGSRLIVLAPVVRGRKGEYRKLFFDLRRQGYVRVRVNGQFRELSEEIELAKAKKHTIEVVVDRLVIRDNLGSRLNDSLETALRLADGVVQVEAVEGSWPGVTSSISRPPGESCPGRPATSSCTASRATASRAPWPSSSGATRRRCPRRSGKSWSTTWPCATAPRARARASGRRRWPSRSRGGPSRTSCASPSRPRGSSSTP